MNNLFRLPFLFLPLLWLAACNPSLPEGAEEVAEAVQISPDYTSITIPYNIAPLDFSINAEGSDYVTHVYSSKGDGLTVSGRDAKFPVDEWHELLEENKSDSLLVDIYVKNDGKWVKYPTIKNYIAADPIDPYISYRLIEPSYVGYEVMTINQRNLTDFNEDVIYNNYAISDGENGQCVNCHNYQNYNRDGNMQMHLRQLKGGTVIVVDGEIRKVDLKTPYTISAGVYPSWHPTERLIAYSTNLTGQNFHTRNIEKVEVQDSESDLILYDIDKNEVSIIANERHKFESFPAWSPDGKWLYFVSAHFEVEDEEMENWYLRERYDSIRYDIFRKPFDLKTRTFGATDTVFMASQYGKSATFPRVSPDGKWLLFALGDYGQFHVWHKSSDLYVMNLESRKVYPLRAANSPDVDSFHSWSSNGRWIMFTSRRDDGSYTRLYFTHFDENGNASKAFILPQEEPGYYDGLFKSYNVPEFMVKKVELDHHDLYEVINSTEAVKAKQHERDSTTTIKDVSDADNFYE